MNDLLLHEQFEIEVLDAMKSARLLDPLVFGGGTMLRLCYDLNRYSVHLDFWLLEARDPDDYHRRAQQALAGNYELTDDRMKHRTILLELRSAQYPKRLKIEIRKESTPCEFQESIAFSTGSNRQVSLRTHTLAETMRRKISAALDRKIIRDFFDIEFLLRRGVVLDIDQQQAADLLAVVQGFSERDFKVTLGSFLDLETREYYVDNGFTYLSTRLNGVINR